MPLTNDEIYVPAVILVPDNIIPTVIVPEATAVTLSDVDDAFIVPVNEQVNADHVVPFVEVARVVPPSPPPTHLPAVLL